MSTRYCTQEEEKEIKEKYLRGDVTYEKLAEDYNLAKSSIINIVKGYPYTGRKGAEETALEKVERMKLERLNAEKCAWDALWKQQYLKFGHYATEWLKLNSILDDGQKNPWGFLTETLRLPKRVRSIKFSSLEGFKEYIQVSFLDDDPPKGADSG